jgi:hypothetical protein
MEIKLKPWQQIVIDEIDKHEEFINSDAFLSLSDYNKNRLSRVHISLPKGSGHTFIAAYIACKYPTAFIYKDMEHWKEICKHSKVDENQLNKNSCVISAYEISHDIFCQTPGNYSSLNDISKKVADKQVVVIDNATEIIDMFPRVIEWLFTVSTGVIVLLG